jgi:glutathione S-transferase
MRPWRGQRQDREASRDPRQAARRQAYLVAEQFSLAEVCYISFLDFLPLMEIAPPSAVAAWSTRVLARQSAQATRPEK